MGRPRYIQQQEDNGGVRSGVEQKNAAPPEAAVCTVKRSVLLAVLVVLCYLLAFGGGDNNGGNEDVLLHFAPTSAPERFMHSKAVKHTKLVTDKRTDIVAISKQDQRGFRRKSTRRPEGSRDFVQLFSSSDVDHHCNNMLTLADASGNRTEKNQQHDAVSTSSLMSVMLEVPSAPTLGTSNQTSFVEAITSGDTPSDVAHPTHNTPHSSPLAQCIVLCLFHSQCNSVSMLRAPSAASLNSDGMIMAKQNRIAQGGGARAARIGEAGRLLAARKQQRKAARNVLQEEVEDEADEGGADRQNRDSTGGGGGEDARVVECQMHSSAAAPHEYALASGVHVSSIKHKLSSKNTGAGVCSLELMKSVLRARKMGCLVSFESGLAAPYAAPFPSAFTYCNANGSTVGSVDKKMADENEDEEGSRLDKFFASSGIAALSPAQQQVVLLQSFDLKTYSMSTDADETGGPEDEDGGGIKAKIDSRGVKMSVDILGDERKNDAVTDSKKENSAAPKEKTEGGEEVLVQPSDLLATFNTYYQHHWFRRFEKLDVPFTNISPFFAKLQRRATVVGAAARKQHSTSGGESDAPNYDHQQFVSQCTLTCILFPQCTAVVMLSQGSACGLTSKLLRSGVRDHNVEAYVLKSRSDQQYEKWLAAAIDVEAEDAGHWRNRAGQRRKGQSVSSSQQPVLTRKLFPQDSSSPITVHLNGASRVVKLRDPISWNQFLAAASPSVGGGLPLNFDDGGSSRRRHRGGALADAVIGEIGGSAEGSSKQIRNLDIAVGVLATPENLESRVLPQLLSSSTLSPRLTTNVVYLVESAEFAHQLQSSLLEEEISGGGKWKNYKGAWKGTLIVKSLMKIHQQQQHQSSSDSASFEVRDFGTSIQNSEGDPATTQSRKLFDWYAIIDDDTFLIPENVVWLLEKIEAGFNKKSSKASSSPTTRPALMLGKLTGMNDELYISGSSGIFLNKEAFVALSRIVEWCLVHENYAPFGDERLGQCARLAAASSANNGNPMLENIIMIDAPSCFVGSTVNEIFSSTRASSAADRGGGVDDAGCSIGVFGSHGYRSQKDYQELEEALNEIRDEEKKGRERQKMAKEKELAAAQEQKQQSGAGSVKDPLAAVYESNMKQAAALLNHKKDSNMAHGDAFVETLLQASRNGVASGLAPPITTKQLMMKMKEQKERRKKG